MIRCWPLRRAARAIKHAHHMRRTHRAISVAVSKPAIVGYVCIVTGGGFWAALPGYSDVTPSYHEPVISGFSDIDFPSPLLAPSLPGGGASASAPMPIAESRWADASPAATGTPIPEPGSALLLATAALVTMLWRR